MSKLRMATPADAGALLEIYAHYVKNTTATFDHIVPTQEEFSRRIADLGRTYPWILYERRGKIVGYAYAAPYADRAVYAWSADLTVYVAEGYRGGGIGSQLYGALIELLRAQGFYTVYALIPQPNEASVYFHSHMGFAHVGRCRQVGYKDGDWLDVDFYELALRPRSGVPQPVVPIGGLAPQQVEAILQRYTR